MLGLGAIFTLFFVTLGPFKLLGPFAQQTQELSPAALRGVAVRAFVVGLAAVIVGGYLGTTLAAKWSVSTPAIEIAAGLILLLVAGRLVMAPYEPPQVLPPLPASRMAATLRLTFPLVVTPYGVAGLIAVLDLASDGETVARVYALLVVVMLLNLLAMLFVREIMRGPVLLALQVLGAVLGVLQFALAIQIIIRGLRDLNILPPA
ncbi:MAG TPA: MarC family protein [Steroidobacteraceae bacterium]|jgi:multiple antibiotic resistance protein|nr:MarC family protein [Steroidobacteraceae bacterium]